MHGQGHLTCVGTDRGQGGDSGKALALREGAEAGQEGGSARPLATTLSTAVPAPAALETSANHAGHARLRLLVLLTRLSPVFPTPHGAPALSSHLPPKAAWEW